MSGRVILRSGQLEVHLLPQVGGSIARFDYLGKELRQPLMRGVDDDDVGPLDVACFPLVPFANRIRDGAFAFRGRVVRIAPNMPPDPSPLHGQGWLHPWEQVSCDGKNAELRYVHKPGEWPWPYEARQRFALDDGGVSIMLECRNLAPDPMPCALGLHPYHPCSAGTVLDTFVETVWTVDDAILPVEQLPATGPHDLRGRAICAQGLDNGFGGWTGSATIRWKGAPVTLTLTCKDARFFQVYAPVAGSIFAAEPVQNANTALNAAVEDWEQLGVEVLEPGASRQLHVRYDVIPV